MTSPDNEGQACTSCAIERGTIEPPGGILFSTDRWTVTHRIPDGDARWPGWLIAQPRRHVRTFRDLSELERRELGEVLRWTEQATHDRLGSSRLYALSLGSTSTTHLHLHLLPQFGAHFDTLDLSQAPMPNTTPIAVAARIRDEDAAAYPLSYQPPGGLARAVWRATTLLRRFSLYTPAKALYRRLAAKDRARGGFGRVAEWYTISWLLVLATCLGVGWIVKGEARSWVIGVALAIAVIRALDILATVTGIVLFEAQSSRFAGVESLARTVILSVVNLAELVAAGAIALSAVAILTGPGSFEPAISGPIDTLLAAAGPIGSSAPVPVTGLAKWTVLSATVIPMYAFLLIASAIVGELSGGLDRTSRAARRD